MTFGERLKLLREENSLTQSELAKKLNISRQSVSNYENGSRFPNDVQLLVKISALFCVSLDYLIGLSNIRLSLPNQDMEKNPQFMENNESPYSAKRNVLEELFLEIDNMPLEDIKKVIKFIKVINGKL
ncbi:helix-turn-helix domain-containing protein [Tissierella carlieri]|uniref:helix-turn-helix domain-containing protein n=1 Tax=Tissierella carlieri TaxID=689904 RepID=UPI001C0FA9EB|nr:helix-turn-helix transcriptional regulator [Tissierella carlieri]MBU5312970.1 helix-turn-helix domain-containing protein [Tissierella carlieri]